MSNTPKHNDKYLKDYRKKLRNNLTPAEAKLWTLLKCKQLEGRKFRRQHSIDNFIVDFYCPKEKLVIELDGEVHNNILTEEKDNVRDLKLKSYGITILRFENKMVFEQQDMVLNAIKEKFAK